MPTLEDLLHREDEKKKWDKHIEKSCKRFQKEIKRIFQERLGNRKIKARLKTKR